MKQGNLARTADLKWPPLLVIGLTGGIASGKSTVSGMFADLGATVINADDAGREVVAPGEPALAELVAAFGPEYLTEEGGLDRKALGSRVFGDRRALAVLNRITHARIGRRLSDQLGDLARRAPALPIVVVEAAVLIEGGWAPLVDRILVVVTQPSVQVARLIDGFGFTAAQADARVHAQLPLRSRLRFADYQVGGEGPLDFTRAQAAAIWDELVHELRQRSGRL